MKKIFGILLALALVVSLGMVTALPVLADVSPGWTDIDKVAAGGFHTAGIEPDGTVVAVGDNEYGQCDVGDWRDIVQVAAGGYRTVGLESDGTVVAVGYNDYGQCDVGGWTGIAQVAAGSNYQGQCDVGGWTDITQVAAGDFHTVGLKADGTVVAVGNNDDGQCSVYWTDITQVAAGVHHTVGLKDDGTVVAEGRNNEGQYNVGDWTDIVQITVGWGHTVGLESDGTVVAVGYNGAGQCDVGGWTDIIQVAAGSYHTVGLKTDCTVVAVGNNDWGQCDVDDWILKLPSVPEETYTLTITAAPGVGGAATDETGGSPYAAGAEVSIKAVANPGYGFVSWTAPAGDFDDATAEETTFTMPAQAVTVIAHFDVAYALAMAVDPVASGDAIDVGAKGAYAPGAGVRIKAVANTGYGFVSWTADPTVTFDDATAEETTFTMPAQAVTVTAHFDVAYTLTISSTPGGSVTTPGEGTLTYDAGTVVSLVATPATGYGFVNWAGDVDTIANVNDATTTITMQGDYEITARFMAGVVAAKTYTVTNSTIDAIDVADIQVVVTGKATITIARYDSNPHPEAPVVYGALASLDLLAQDEFRNLNIWRDVCVIYYELGTELEIRLYYTDAQADGFEENTLRPFWCDGTAWKHCSPDAASGVNTTDITINSTKYSGYMWAKITATTSPSLTDDLGGTPWGGYGHPKEVEGPCFIATAAYGTDTAKEIDILREFRDTVLLPNSLGARCVSLYYEISPPIADFISQREILRTAMRVGFVDPIVAILNWSHDLWTAGG